MVCLHLTSAFGSTSTLTFSEWWGKRWHREWVHVCVTIQSTQTWCKCWHWRKRRRQVYTELKYPLIKANRIMCSLRFRSVWTTPKKALFIYFWDFCVRLICDKKIVFIHNLRCFMFPLSSLLNCSNYVMCPGLVGRKLSVFINLCIQHFKISSSRLQCK